MRLLNTFWLWLLWQHNWFQFCQKHYSLLFCIDLFYQNSNHNYNIQVVVHQDDSNGKGYLTSSHFIILQILRWIHLEYLVINSMESHKMSSFLYFTTTIILPPTRYNVYINADALHVHIIILSSSNFFPLPIFKMFHCTFLMDSQ